jgi:glucose-1-phosphate adenylyltransferase
MILAGGRVDELAVLTLKRPKSAVPFGGIYRIIDFPLTNLMRTGIDQIGILSQYRLTSLMEHVGLGGAWDLQGRRRGVHILPPYLVAGRADWYRGTADAVYQNLHFIDAHAPELVMVLSGDHVYHMDYGPLLRMHEDRQADLTIALKAVPIESASRFGIATLAPDGRVTSYEEKPRRPRGNLASLTIYVFNKEVLLACLMENTRTGKTFHFYDEIIPRMVEENRVFGYVFDGYWAYSRTLDEYYRASMDLVAAESPIDLAAWQMRTNPDVGPRGDLVPARFLKGSRVASSIVPGGCLIEGEVTGSVLSPRVVVRKGARVVDSVVMSDAVIEEGAHVQRAILDKNVQIGRAARVGTDGGGTEGDTPVPANREVPQSLASGVTVVGRDARIGARARIGANCLIYSDLRALPRNRVPDGSTVR